MDNSSPLCADQSRPFFQRTPAADWHDALPSGNGVLGACVYGGVYTERVCLNHEGLWIGTRTQELPDVSTSLPHVRNLLDQGELEKAEHVYRDALTEQGYQGSIGRSHPAADLCCCRPPIHRHRNYRRSLDMTTGEVTVSWSERKFQLSRRLFVSRADDLIVWELSADAGTVSASFSLGPHDLNDAIDMGANALKPDITFDSSAEGSLLTLKGTYHGESLDYTVLARVIPTGGTMATADQAISVTDADRILVVAQIFAYEPADHTALEELNATYEELLERHTALHRPLFLGTQVSLATDPRSNEELLLDAYGGDLSPALAQRMADYGRYLLISSSCPGHLPSHLQGVWNGDYRPAWNCIYMLNENLQMNYWQAMPGGLGDMKLAVFDYYESYLDDYRANARNLFGCRGIVIPAVTTPGSGLAKNTSAHIICWTAGAGWLAQHYYDYYLYTGDRDFLVQRVIPFMKEVVDFYEDFLTLGPDGTLVSSPSTSPENTANPGYNQGSQLRISINATMDIAVAREVFTHLAEACDETGDAAESARCRRMLAQMPEYQINEDGAVKEWMHPDFLDNYRHRHQSHLYPVFPGFEITEEDAPELFQAFRTAVEKRLVIGLKEQTGWSLAHMANIFARLGDSERAHATLALLAQNCTGTNLFTYHNDYRHMGITGTLIWGRRPPFQIDANMGWTAAVYEMLAFSRPGTIKLLPACPEEWASGKLSSLHCRGGVTLSMRWNASAASLQVQLLSLRQDQTVALHLPGFLNREVRTLQLKANQPTEITIGN